MEKNDKGISLLARWKNKKQKEGNKKAIGKAPIAVDIPLSNAQQRLWFLHQLHANNPFYNYTESLVFHGALQVAALQESLQVLFEYNEILRSYYPVKEGQPILKIDQQATIPLNSVDYCELSEADLKIKVAELQQQQASTPFNISTLPLCKCTVIQCNEKKHILCITMHHIITDHWSVGLLKAQLATYYTAICQGIPPKMTMGTEIQFSDYTYWQRNQEINATQLAYWKEKLSGTLPVLNLPTDYQRPVQPAFKGLQHTQEFSVSFSKQILDCAQQLSVTPFVLLLSVYYLLLSRYTGQHDICIGTPISNRNQKSLENILGFFIDTIVLRNQIEVSTSFAVFVQEVRKHTLEAFSNKDIPFDVVVKELQLERSLGVNPCFQVMFLYNTVSTVPSFGTDVILEHAEFDSGVAKFDLTLAITEDQGKLSATFEYDIELFDSTTIERFQEQYALLLQEIVANPEQTISLIPMLTENEKTFFFEQRAMVKPIAHQYTGIHHYIEVISQRTPHHIALVFGTTKMTYQELNIAATALAKRVVAKTNGEKGIVGVCAVRSLEMIVGIIAILKAGCAYLPIDPDYPEQRIAYMIDDAKVDIIVTQSALATLFKDQKVTNLLFEDQTRSTNTSTEVLPAIDPQDIAYVIYTSGSTGKPKGVPIPHQNIVNSTQGRQTFYTENPAVFLLVSSIAFDSSKAGIFWTLCTGGTLVIAEKRIEQDITKIEEIITKHAVSHTLLLPSLYKLILEHCNSTKLAQLTTVIVAGEVCPKELCTVHFETLSDTQLYNEYGPTEATVWCIAHQVQPEDATGIIPIGKPVANAEVYILDSNLRTLPFGAIGELYIGGSGLAKQYLNKPELTHKAYIDHPFHKDPNQKLYKTGDLGRYTHKGTIEFLGRADQQVKIRGFRIELDEIENVITSHPKVQDAVVIVKEVKTNNGIMDSEQLPTVAELSTALQQLLPSETAIEDLIKTVESLNTDEHDFLVQQMNEENSRS